MKLFCRGATVVAIHDDNQIVETAVYGDNIEIIVVDDGTALERIGEPPEDGQPDLRPLQRPEQSLEDAKAQAIIAIVQAADRFTASILSKYPEAERTGWPQKQAECAIIIAADDASKSITTALNKTVLLKTIAATAGWDNAATVVAARAIIAKADEFATIAAMVEVMRSSAETTINAAKDMVELEAAKVSLSAQAQALAAKYGLAG